MRKTMLTLAALGAFTSAVQAQVSIGGVVEVSVKNYKVGNATSAARSPANEARIDDDYVPRFWLSGTEDLGGGMSALFYIENRFNMDVANNSGPGNGLSNGDTYLGLKGAWGQVTLGKHIMMYTQGLSTEWGKNGIPALPLSLYGTLDILSSINGVGITITRVNNSILYKTPNFSGFSGSLGYSTATGGSEGNLACTNTGVQNYATTPRWCRQQFHALLFPPLPPAAAAMAKAAAHSPPPITATVRSSRTSPTGKNMLKANWACPLRRIKKSSAYPVRTHSRLA